MGGQTIRLLEQLLRNGDLEEMAYQKSTVAQSVNFSKAIKIIELLRLRQLRRHMMGLLRQMI